MGRPSADCRFGAVAAFAMVICLRSTVAAPQDPGHADEARTRSDESTKTAPAAMAPRAIDTGMRQPAAVGTPEWTERSAWFLKFCQEQKVTVPECGLDGPDGKIPLESWQRYQELQAPYCDVLRWGVPTVDKQSRVRELIDKNIAGVTAARARDKRGAREACDEYLAILKDVYGEQVGPGGFGNGTVMGRVPLRGILWLTHPSQRKGGVSAADLMRGERPKVEAKGADSEKPAGNSGADPKREGEKSSGG